MTQKSTPKKGFSLAALLSILLILALALAVVGYVGKNNVLIALNNANAQLDTLIAENAELSDSVGTLTTEKEDLTATVEKRAMRRYKELVAKGEQVDLEQLQKDIAERDKQDMEREISPLRQAEDAIYLDTSDMTIDEVTNYILNLVGEKENAVYYFSRYCEVHFESTLYHFPAYGC